MSRGEEPASYDDGYSDALEAACEAVRERCNHTSGMRPDLPCGQCCSLIAAIRALGQSVGKKVCETCSVVINELYILDDDGNEREWVVDNLAGLVAGLNGS